MKYEIEHFYIVDEDTHTARCSCGLTFVESELGDNMHYVKCPNCGTYEVKAVSKSVNSRVRVQRGDEFFKCIEESQQKIVFGKFKPTMRWYMDKETNKPVFNPIVDEKTGELSIDFKNKKFTISNLREKGTPINRNNLINFFGSCYRTNEVINLVNLQSNKNLLKAIGFVDMHGNGASDWSGSIKYNEIDGMVKFFNNFDQFEELQVLANCGCPVALLKNIAVELTRDERTIRLFHKDIWYHDYSRDSAKFKIEIGRAHV